MKSKLILILLMMTGLTACSPSLYIVFENHSGGHASLIVTLEEANSYWKMKSAGEKSIDFTPTAIEAVVEYSYGSGSWDDEHLDALVKGVTRIEFISGVNRRTLSDKGEIRNLFKDNIFGKEKNGIRIKVN